MKKTKRLLSTFLAIIMLFGVVSIVANAASVSTTSQDYGYMVATDAKISKSVGTVKVYGNYDYINFYINSYYDDMYFFYEIYSDKKMTKLVASDYTYCSNRGTYSWSPMITLKGIFKTGTYYGVTYAAEIDGAGNATISEDSVATFKLSVNRSPKFNQKMVPLKSVTNTVNGPTIKWHKLSTDATKYVIYRRSMSGTKWTKVGTVNGSTLSFTDKSVKNKNGKYIYTVKALNKSGTASRYLYNGLYCLFAKAPTVSSVATTSDNRIQVKWNNTSGSAKYRVYRSENGGGWKLIANNVKGTSYYDTTTKSNGKNYKYTVRAVIPTTNGDAISSYYNVNKTVDFLKQPTLNPVEVVETGLKITWEQVAGAENYTIYRKTLEQGASWVSLGKVSKDVSEFIDTTANAESGFIYTVRSEGKTSRGSYSGTGVEYFILSKPVITSVEPGYSGKHTLNWTGDSRTKSYNVYLNKSNEWKLLGTTGNTHYTTTEQAFGKVEFRVEAVRGTLSSMSDSYVCECYPAVNVTARENLVAGNRLQWEVHSLAEKYNVYRATIDASTGEKTQFELLGTLNVLGETKYLEILDENAIDGVNYVYKINGFYYGEERESSSEIKIERTIPEIDASNTIVELISSSSYKYSPSNYMWITPKDGRTTPHMYYFYNEQTGNWVQVHSHYSNGNSHRLDEKQLNDAGVYPDVNGEYKLAVVYLTPAEKEGYYKQTTSIDRDVTTIKFPGECVTEIAAELESKQIKISWKSVEGATKYIVSYTDTSFNENTIEFENSASETISCYLPTDLNNGSTYEVKLTVLFEDGSKSIFGDKKVILHGMPKMTYVNKYYVYVEDSIPYGANAVLYRKAPGSSEWEVVKSLDDFDSYSTKYGNAYRDEKSDGTVAYTYTARCIADKSKVGAETDIGSWYDEKGITLKV